MYLNSVGNSSIYDTDHNKKMSKQVNQITDECNKINLNQGNIKLLFCFNLIYYFIFKMKIMNLFLINPLTTTL